MTGIGTNGGAAWDGSRERELAALPTAQLLRRLSDQTSLLMREEVALAKAELAEKGRQLSQGAGMLGAAAVLGLFGLGALTATAILALDEAFAPGLAALIVAAALLLLAGGLALAGRGRLRRAQPAMPEQTVATVKEDMQWARIRARAARRP